MSDERFARQHRCGPPPGFPLASPCTGIAHRLSGPDGRAPTQPARPPEERRLTRLAGGVTRGSLPLAACVTNHRTPTETQLGKGTPKHTHHPTSPSQQQQPVKRGRTSPIRFHFALRFTTVALARTSDSLVRVSRRADHDQATSSVLGIRQLPRGRPRWRTRRKTCLAPFLGFRLLGNPSPSVRPATNEFACMAAHNRHRPANETMHHNRTPRPSSRRQPYRRRPISRPRNAPTKRPSADHRQQPKPSTTTN
jgi:hypothetical protein